MSSTVPHLEWRWSLISFAASFSRQANGNVSIKIYNNVLRNCKGHGITASRGSTSAPVTTVSVYNNTLVPPIGGRGINVGKTVDPCTVHDNIVAGKELSVAGCSTTNNSTESSESQKFMDDAGPDFRLTATSPAVDVGTSNCPDRDHLGTSRPQEGACDVGAFEFKTSASGDSKPNPPITVSVEATAIRRAIAAHTVQARHL